MAPARGGGGAGARIHAWLRPEIRELAGYAIPAADGLIKLDAMENPWPWPGDLEQAWLESLRGCALNRYPDGPARALNEALARFFRIPEGAGTLLGNGSDELIQLLQLALGGGQRVVLAPAPSFVMYELIARWTGMRFVGVPLREDFTLDVPALLEAVERTEPALVFLARPNNPTGNLYPADQVAEILDRAPGLVVVDEAYEPFSGESLAGWLPERDNLVILRTVSKLGLAGLRLGLLAAHPDWVRELDKVRLPYNINTLTQASARFFLGHARRLQEQAAAIVAEREGLAARLAALPGVTVFPSCTNFILFRVPDADATDRALRAGGVLVKNLNGAGGPLAGCLRVTVGRPEENTRFLEVLGAALG